jgi:hypothetical protein
MKSIDAQMLADATINALERTAMVLAEAAPPDQTSEPVTRFAKIRYSGPSQGTVELGATEGFLREVAASLLGVESSEVNVDVQGMDALRELANILGGSVILAMSGETCRFSLGLPESAVSLDLSVPTGPQAASCAVVAEGGVLRVKWTCESIAKAA